MRRRRGFSLIELVVVIAIAGVIIAVSVPQYIKYRAKQDARTAIAVLAADLKQGIAQTSQASPQAAGGTAITFSTAITTMPSNQYVVMLQQAGATWRNARAGSIDPTTAITFGGNAYQALGGSVPSNTAVVLVFGGGSDGLAFDASGALLNQLTGQTKPTATITLTVRKVIQESMSVSALGAITTAEQLL